jgi:hydroxypyruvate isomerase
MLYGGLPLLERPRAAARDGFLHAESWWPFDVPTPDAGQVAAFCDALTDADVQLAAVNLDAGDPKQGYRGLLSIPTYTQRVRANLDAVADLVTRTGCRIVNALYGNREDGFEPGEQDELAHEQLVLVADRLAEVGATVVVETLNLVDSPRFPLTDICVTAEVIRRVNEASRQANVRHLLDTYHLATMGADPAQAVGDHGGLVGHVQFADFPGRGQPGSGGIDFGAVEQALRAVGYDGFIGLEYDPTVPAAQREEGIA